MTRPSAVAKRPNRTGYPAFIETSITLSPDSHPPQRHQSPACHRHRRQQKNRRASSVSFSYRIPVIVELLRQRRITRQIRYFCPPDVLLQRQRQLRCPCPGPVLQPIIGQFAATSRSNIQCIPTGHPHERYSPPGRQHTAHTALSRPRSSTHRGSRTRSRCSV